jgi:rhodanese-related sulfurtransferase
MSMIGRSAERRLLAALLVFILGVAAILPVRAGESPVTVIDGATLSGLIDQRVTVIDIRRPDEWRETGVVPGSRLITAYDAEGRLEPGFLRAVAAVAGKGEPVALICRSGNRSAAAAQLLAGDAGYTRLYNVEGGIRAWSAAGRPLQPCPTC